jgi:hypothetical protein
MGNKPKGTLRFKNKKKKIRILKSRSMDSICSKGEGDEKCVQILGRTFSRSEEHLEDEGMDGRITLN